MEQATPAFSSKHPFDHDPRLDGLLIVCSDGRFEQQVNEFREHLRQRLGLRKLDRYFVPGAQMQFCASKTGHPNSDHPTDFWTRFLIENHQLNHVVIIGHELCAGYVSAPAYKNLTTAELRRAQENDLRSLRSLLEKTYSHVRVHCYYMRPSDDHDGVDFYLVR